MKLLSVKINGATGLRKVGKTVALDFASFDRGVIAIVGDNGMGKSTLMRLMTPYAVVGLSEVGTYDHFYGKNAERVNRYEIGGDEIETKILIDAVGRKSEGYITRNGKPICNGKMKDYEKVVEEIFGSEKFFFQSAFRDQKAHSFASVQRAELRGMMAELLDLAKTAEYEKAASAKASALLKDLDTSRAILAAIEEVSSIEILESELTKLLQLQDSYDSSIAKQSAKIEEIVKKIAEQGAMAELVKLKIKACAEYEGKLAELKEAVRENGQSKSKYKLEWTANRTSLDKDRTRLEKIISNKEVIAEGVRALLETRAKVVAHEEKKVRYDEKYRDLLLKEAENEAAIQNFQRERLSKQNVLTKFLAEAEAKRKESEHRIQSLHDEIERMEQAAMRMNDVPCKVYPDIQPACMFLADAARAKNDLPNKRRMLKKETQAIIELNKEDHATLADETERIGIMITEAEAKKADDKEAASLDLQIIGYMQEDHAQAVANNKKYESQRWESLAVEAEVAQARRDEVVKRIEELDANYDENTKRLVVEESHLLRKIGELTEKTESLKGEIEKSKPIDYQSEKVWLESELDVLKRKGSVISEEIVLKKSDIERGKKQAQRKKELEDTVSGIAREYQEYAVLARACGKTGIQALELDAAGPTISEIANELLGDSFGTNFRIRFDTQRLNAKGETLEDYRITVLSGGEGEQDMRTLSGGEDVWVNAAIMQAIAIYRMRASEHRIETMFLDEVDGALTVARAHDYLNMVRRTQQIAGLHHVIIITHRKELQDQISQKIWLGRADIGIN